MRREGEREMIEEPPLCCDAFYALLIATMRKFPH